jgi:hypothetical protein
MARERKGKKETESQDTTVIIFLYLTLFFVRKENRTARGASSLGVKRESSVC